MQAHGLCYFGNAVFLKLADRQGIGVRSRGGHGQGDGPGAERPRPAARSRVGAKLRTCSFDYMQAERCIFGRPTRSETMAERKTRVAILFGGRSAEHDGSQASAANVLRFLPPNRYFGMLLGIAKERPRSVACRGKSARFCA